MRKLFPILGLAYAATWGWALAAGADPHAVGRSVTLEPCPHPETSTPPPPDFLAIYGCCLIPAIPDRFFDPDFCAPHTSSVGMDHTPQVPGTGPY